MYTTEYVDAVQTKNDFSCTQYPWIEVTAYQSFTCGAQFVAAAHSPYYWQVGSELVLESFLFFYIWSCGSAQKTNTELIQP